MARESPALRVFPERCKMSLAVQGELLGEDDHLFIFA